MIVYDLCCGKGGWAKAFLEEGFEVVGFDIKRRKYPGQLIQADVRMLEHLPGESIIVASPNCEGFSEARPDKIGRPNQADFDLVLACLRVIYYSKPRWWVLENVRGAVRYLGRHALRYGPFYFWGYFPDFLKAQEDRYHHWSKSIQKSRHSSALARAEIPFEIANLFAKSMKAELAS